MRTALRWLVRIATALLALPVLLVALLLAAINTGPGQDFVARQAAALTGGKVSLTGLHGTLPVAPRLDRIEVADKQGTWLVIEHAALDWSPLVLLSGTARLSRLAAERVVLARLPASDPTVPPSGPFRLPLRVEADQVRVSRAEIGPALVGTPLALAVDGSAALAALDDGTADLRVRDLDGGGSYRARGTLAPATVDATVDVNEPAGGVIARVARLPDIAAPLLLHGTLSGPSNAAATVLTLAAGPARVEARGTVSIDSPDGDLTVTAQAPAMTPAPGIGFQALSIDAHVQGTPPAPRGSGSIRIEAPEAKGAGARALALDFAADGATARLSATADGARLPGPKPDLLAAAPLTLTANVRLDAPDRPVRFALDHPLLRLSGEVRTAGELGGRVHLVADSLAPLVGAAGIAVEGRTTLDLTAVQHDETIEATLAGTLGITAGLDPAPALVGPEARIEAAGTLRGTDLALSRLALDGRAVKLSASCALAAGRLDATTELTLPDLAAAAPTLRGVATMRAHATGPLDSLGLTATLAADIATGTLPREHIEATAEAAGLPGAPSGRFRATGRLDGAPIDLAADLSRAADGALSITIDRAVWKSAKAEARLALAAGATLPTGTATLRVGSLADARRLSGLPLAGSVEASLDLPAGPRPTARATLRASGAGVAGTASAQRVTLDATVTDPLGNSAVQANLVADGVRAGAIAGAVRMSVTGPRSALAIHAEANASGLAGGPARLAAQATLDLPAQRVAVASLSASARGETLRLLAPARISFGETVAVDRLRLGLRDAVLDLAGRVSPTLDLTASLRNGSADLTRIADPALRADGTLSADARLTGTPARPAGTVHVAATGLRLRQGPAAGLPPVSVMADATLAGGSARVNGAVTAGANRLTVSGTAPIDPKAALDLHAAGSLDLALTDPILTPSGRRARGMATIDAGLAGTLAAPRANGTVRLARGEFQDFGQGLRISDVAALIEAQGDHVGLTQLTGRAGKGTISASGSVGLAAPRPVDLRLALRAAQPLASDKLNAVLDSDLTVRGSLDDRLDLAGRVKVDRADIQVPDRLPASVAVLDVRRPGEAPPPPPPAPGLTIGLDVTVSAPGQIFVRGRGIDAELTGDLHAGGTAAAPQMSGGFTLRRGSVSVAGTTLTFTSGTATFDGSGKLDPVLDLVASSTSGGVTATLEVTGYASAPVIKLSSVPELPQDEVLAHLLFGQPASSLGPFQLGEIALALAQLTGAPGSGLDPLGDARKALGLDRLSVGGGSGGSSGGATLEAGRYVARGVYVGARQGTGGGGTQAQVQIDITKGLKLNTTVGTGGGSATGSNSASSSGTSVGLTYQFEY